jgi:hypothetical protein
VVRELGLERRETVRSLSAMKNKKIKDLNSVREDQFRLTSSNSIGHILQVESATLVNNNY